METYHRVWCRSRKSSWQWFTNFTGTTGACETMAICLEKQYPEGPEFVVLPEGIEPARLCLKTPVCPKR